MSIDDVRKLLLAGADKVSINSAAISNPQFVAEAANKFGSQCIVVAIDAKKVSEPAGDQFEIFTHGGRRGTGIEAIGWAKRMAELGAGEILLTSMDRDGTKSGFDLALTRAISDAVLIIAGIAGLGALIQQLPILLEIFRYAGSAYLIWFGISAARRAFKPQTLEAKGDGATLRATLLTVAALTWLNPHVYLDTVILLGSIGNQFAPEQWLFAFGAATGSFVWFFSLGFGARLLSRFVSSERFWKYLDLGIALVMFVIAGTLLFGL